MAGKCLNFEGAFVRNCSRFKKLDQAKIPYLLRLLMNMPHLSLGIALDCMCTICVGYTCVLEKVLAPSCSLWNYSQLRYLCRWCIGKIYLHSLFKRELFTFQVNSLTMSISFSPLIISCVWYLLVFSLPMCILHLLNSLHCWVFVMEYLAPSLSQLSWES